MSLNTQEDPINLEDPLWDFPPLLGYDVYIEPSTMLIDLVMPVGKVMSAAELKEALDDLPPDTLLMNGGVIS